MYSCRQVIFHSQLPNGQGPRQVICQLNQKKSNQRLAQGPGLEKSTVRLSGTSRFSCRASHFSFSLAQWARAQVVCQLHLNIEKINLRLDQGKQNLRASCPKCKLEFKFFSSPACPCAVIRHGHLVWTSLFIEDFVAKKIETVQKVHSSG